VAVTIGGTVSVAGTWVSCAGVEVADVSVLGISGSFVCYDLVLVVASVASPESVAVRVNVARGILWLLEVVAGVVAGVLSEVISVVVDESSLAGAGEVPASDTAAVGIGTTCRPVCDVSFGHDVVVQVGDDSAERRGLVA